MSALTLAEQECREPQAEKTFTVTDTVYGYAHCRITGTYTGPVTAADVAKKFYHPLFRGREASAHDGKFSVIVHTD